MSHQALKSLHTALIDASQGYEKAADEAEDRDLVTLFTEMDALHKSAHEDVHKALGAAGEAVDDDGSFMGTVHKTVIGVWSAVTGIDEGSLGSFASGEEHTLEHYAEAIEEEDDSRVGDMLRFHESKLAEMVIRMKQIEASAEASKQS